MIVGDTNTFAIESEITLAYERLGQLALGFFVIHVMGRCYGVREPDATMLANSFDEVGKRIARRGSHTPSFPMDANADEIAYAFRRTVYGKCEEGELFFGLSVRQFTDSIDSNCLAWAPDGDEAFDDHSYVLQFEDGNEVRLVAFKGTPDFLYDPTSLNDVRLSQDEFYGILQEWHGRFKDEWGSLPKA
jgi:hypothetical protein